LISKFQKDFHDLLFKEFENTDILVNVGSLLKKSHQIHYQIDKIENIQLSEIEGYTINIGFNIKSIQGNINKLFEILHQLRSLLVTYQIINNNYEITNNHISESKVEHQEINE